MTPRMNGERCGSWMPAAGEARSIGEAGPQHLGGRLVRQRPASWRSPARAPAKAPGTTRRWSSIDLARPGADRVLAIERRAARVGAGVARRPGSRRDRGSLQRPVRRGGPAPPRRPGLRRATADRRPPASTSAGRDWRGDGRLFAIGRRGLDTVALEVGHSQPATSVRPGCGPKAVGGLLAIASPIGARRCVRGSWSARRRDPRPSTVVDGERGRAIGIDPTTPGHDACSVGDRPRGSG